MDLNNMSAKVLQHLLKRILNKVETLDFHHRLGFGTYDKNQILSFRAMCKNTKLRHIYYRLVTRDFYTKERMLRFGMSRDDMCSRCGIKETYRHLFWECIEARRVWESFNDYLRTIGQPLCEVKCYEEVFRVDAVSTVSVIKVRVIQAMIQVERPTGWNQDCVRKLAIEIKSIEIYNSVEKGKLEMTKTKWRNVR